VSICGITAFSLFCPGPPVLAPASDHTPGIFLHIPPENGRQVYSKNATHNASWRKFLMSVKEGKLRKAKTEEVNVGSMFIH
jgi:hypothetical protein